MSFGEAMWLGVVVLLVACVVWALVEVGLTLWEGRHDA